MAEPRPRKQELVRHPYRQDLGRRITWAARVKLDWRFMPVVPLAFV